MRVLHGMHSSIRQESFASKTALFASLLTSAIALGAAMAHALELPNKINLSQAAYFTVQQIYSGWDALGFLLAVQLVSIIAVAVLYRHQKQVLAFASLAIISLVLAQAIFWIFTYPVNIATANWTQAPENWDALKRQWEYSHAAGAVSQILVMIWLAAAALARNQVVIPH
ncbi:MAG: DUF1772 domain-containing protein [Parvibaculaceae bacterium]